MAFTRRIRQGRAAVRYERLTYDEACAQAGCHGRHGIVMCREYDMPLKVFNINRHGDLVRIVRGENVAPPWCGMTHDRLSQERSTARMVRAWTV